MTDRAAVIDIMARASHEHMRYPDDFAACRPEYIAGMREDAGLLLDALAAHGWAVVPERPTLGMAKIGARSGCATTPCERRAIHCERRQRYSRTDPTTKADG